MSIAERARQITAVLPVALSLSLLACTSVHGTEPAGPVNRWIRADSPYYECPTQRAYLLDDLSSPRVLMTPAPSCLAGTAFTPYLMNLHHRDGGADHFIVYNDETPPFAYELVFPVDRSLDAELRIYDDSAPGGLALLPLPDGGKRISGLPTRVVTCWSPFRKEREPG